MTEAMRVKIDDSALVERSQQGDSSAMETLILRYQDRIYNSILKICSNSHDASELTQETFVKVIENIDKFEQRSSFYTWVFRIAVNLTLNYCRKKVKLGFKSLDSQIASGGHEGQMLKDAVYNNKAVDPETVAQCHELQTLILGAIMQLDDDHRAVIVLRDIEGMNYAGIAQVLEVELGTVKSRISRARANLRDILKAVVQ